MLLGGELWYKLRQAAEIDTDESAKDEGVALSETDYANVSARRYYSTYWPHKTEAARDGDGHDGNIAV